MATHSAPSPPTIDDQRASSSGFSLYFAFFGGSIAWTIHLLGAYLIAEFGCLSNTGQDRHLGIAGLTWSLAILSALMFILAAASALVGYLALRRLQQKGGNAERETRNDDHNAPESIGSPSAVHRSSFIVHRSTDTRVHLARAGAIMSAIFALVLICQSVPIFYYLRGC